MEAPIGILGRPPFFDVAIGLRIEREVPPAPVEHPSVFVGTSNKLRESSGEFAAEVENRQSTALGRCRRLSVLRGLSTANRFFCPLYLASN